MSAWDEAEYLGQIYKRDPGNNLTRGLPTPPGWIPIPPGSHAPDWTGREIVTFTLNNHGAFSAAWEELRTLLDHPHTVEPEERWGWLRTPDASTIRFGRIKIREEFLRWEQDHPTHVLWTRPPEVPQDPKEAEDWRVLHRESRGIREDIFSVSNEYHNPNSWLSGETRLYGPNFMFAAPTSWASLLSHTDPVIEHLAELDRTTDDWGLSPRKDLK